MLRAFWTSKTAMNAMQDKLDSISNNIANVGTDGYKKVDVSFSDLLSSTLVRNEFPVSAERKSDPYVGTGVKSDQWIRDTSDGSLTPTGLNTDFAIQGEGYFAVTKGDGTTAYTRNGSFNVDTDGQLVDKNGDRVVMEKYIQPFKLDAKNFSVNEDGVVFAKENGQNVQVGKINLYNTVGDDALVSVGNNLYVPKTGAQVYQVTGSKINQKSLEASNVDLGSEMTDMIIAQRAYEVNSKALQTSDNMWGMINSLRR